jgi:hypothetical protein
MLPLHETDDEVDHRFARPLAGHAPPEPQYRSNRTWGTQGKLALGGPRACRYGPLWRGWHPWTSPSSTWTFCEHSPAASPPSPARVDPPADRGALRAGSEVANTSGSHGIGVGRLAPARYRILLTGIGLQSKSIRTLADWDGSLAGAQQAAIRTVECRGSVTSPVPLPRRPGTICVDP